MRPGIEETLSGPDSHAHFQDLVLLLIVLSHDRKRTRPRLRPCRRVLEGCPGPRSAGSPDRSCDETRARTAPDGNSHLPGEVEPPDRVAARAIWVLGGLDPGDCRAD